MAIRADEGKHTPRPARLSAPRPAVQSPRCAVAPSTTPGAPVIEAGRNGSAPGGRRPRRRRLPGPRAGACGSGGCWCWRRWPPRRSRWWPRTTVSSGRARHRLAARRPGGPGRRPARERVVPARPAALYNLVVGVIAWLGLPPGALYVVFVASLLGTGLLLHGLLVRWGIGPLIVRPDRRSRPAEPEPALHHDDRQLRGAGGAAAGGVAVGDAAPPRRSGTGWLLATSALVTLTALTRSLFNPPGGGGARARAGGPAGVPPPGPGGARHPDRAVGGWMLKNEVLFGTPTTSSWLGFNMQRGIVARRRRHGAGRRPLRRGQRPGAELPVGPARRVRRVARRLRAGARPPGGQRPPQARLPGPPGRQLQPRVLPAAVLAGPGGRGHAGLGATPAATSTTGRRRWPCRTGGRDRRRGGHLARQRLRDAAVAGHRRDRHGRLEPAAVRGGRREPAAAPRRRSR